ncbi:MAG: AraC family transcriptional regulator [Clostridia bacterium]|nr:AraC family transcriptional regulator [Clostridia bacterium]
MKYEIVQLKEKVIQGIKIKTSNQNEKNIQDIGKIWQKLFADGIYEKIPNKVNNKTIGLYTEYEGDYTKPYMFLAGAEVILRGETKQEVDSIVVPSGKYARFIIIGDVQKSVGQAWKEIWDMDLKRKYTCDFEEYQNNSENMQKQEIHIYIAIED